jgi:hypothetical protein
MSPVREAEAYPYRDALPSSRRVTNVFVPLRRQRASTTAGACRTSHRTGCDEVASSTPRKVLPLDESSLRSFRSLPRDHQPPFAKRLLAHETRSRRFTAPSMGFVVLSAESVRVIGVSGCLPNTVRSQRFSRSQRVSPTLTLRLCFTPLPPLGFLVFRAFIHSGQP